MTIEEYKRGIRAMSTVMPKDRCMIVAIVNEAGQLTLHNVGDKKECMRVYKAITLAGCGFDSTAVKNTYKNMEGGQA